MSLFLFILNPQILAPQGIDSAIQVLPERRREIFVLCRFGELKYAEIAEKLGISVKTVKKRMGIALKKLYFARDKFPQSINREKLITFG